MLILAGQNYLKMATKNNTYSYPYCILKKVKQPKMQYKTIHLSAIFVLIFIILKLKSEKTEYSTELLLNHSYNLQKNSFAPHIKNVKSKPIKSDSLVRSVCLLLILLSNDIHPNPGPVKMNLAAEVKNSTCSLCGYNIAAENSIKCDCCSKEYHLNCTSNANTQINSSFEWICPTENCPNNHEENINSNIKLNSENRFAALNANTSTSVDENNSISYHAQPSEEIDKIQSENLTLLNVLPKINFEDYQGMDLCRGCSKPVKTNQQAISCDKCSMWIHRKCSDMSKKSYDKHRYVQYFPWICNKCRNHEEIIHVKFDPGNLNDKEKPQDLSDIKADKNELLIINMNCRSSIRKTEEINYIFNELNPDIACHCETWFDDSVPRQANIPPGYKVIRKDRNEMFKQRYGKTSGGGIAIYYKEHMQVERKENLSDDIEEILWVHIKEKSSFMLGTMYRASYTDTLDEQNGECKIEENIRKVSEISDNLIMTGDFNIDLNNEKHKDTIKLSNIYDTYGLTQLVNKPTRIDPKSKRKTLIDHIWTSMKQVVKSHGTFISISDHLGTYVKLNIGKNKPKDKFIKIRSYANYSEEILNTNLSNAISESNVEQHINEKKINAATNELIEVFQQTINKIAPIKIIRQKDKTKHIPWYTTELKNLIKDKNQSLSNYFYFGLDVFKKHAKELTNKIKHLKTKLKSKYFTDRISEFKDNPRKYWQIINDLTQRTETKETTEPDKMSQDKADNFNQYFATVGENIQKKLKKQFQIENLSEIQGFNFKLETSASIGKMIDNIKSNVATGHDDISAKIIKDAKPTLVPILMKLVNLSYEVHTFPDCMKIAAIKALHKKEDKNDFANYRPISILPTISKVFERSATAQLVHHLETNNIINPSQHAYRKGHSTITCLFEVVNHLYKLIDDKKIAAVISLDLSKAFDSINHNLLINKLSTMGISEGALLWIKSYLSDRQQYVKFKDFISTKQPITAGVPQGSIIGPLLFICYINDLYPTFDHESKVYSYADDTQIIVHANKSDQLTKKIEKAITTAQKWYSENSMQNNTGKSEILITCNKGPTNHIKIKIFEEGKRKLLVPKPFIKILGVYLDEKLDWKKHLKFVKKTAFNSIRNLHRVNHLVPVKTRIYLYNTLIVPHFDYADIIFGGCSKKNSKYLQTAQNFAVRSITGTKKSVSPSESFRKLNFLNLENRRKVHEAVFAHKSLLDLNPQQINLNYVRQLSTGHTRNSTHSSLNVPLHRNAKFQKSPFFRTIKAWNSSPKDIPTHNIKSFKTHFQRNLIHSIHKN